MERKHTKWRLSLKHHIDCCVLLHFILLFEKGGKNEATYAELKGGEVSIQKKKRKKGFLKCFFSSKPSLSRKSIFNSMYFPAVKLDIINSGSWSSDFISLSYELCLVCNCERNLLEDMTQKEKSTEGMFFHYRRWDCRHCRAVQFSTALDIKVNINHLLCVCVCFRAQQWAVVLPSPPPPPTPSDIFIINWSVITFPGLHPGVLWKHLREELHLPQLPPPLCLHLSSRGREEPAVPASPGG